MHLTISPDLAIYLREIGEYMLRNGVFPFTVSFCSGEGTFFIDEGIEESFSPVQGRAVVWLRKFLEARSPQ